MKKVYTTLIISVLFLQCAQTDKTPIPSEPGIIEDTVVSLSTNNIPNEIENEVIESKYKETSNDKIYNDFPEVVSNEFIESVDTFSLTTSFKKYKEGTYTFVLDVLKNGHVLQPKNKGNEAIIGCGNEFGAFIEITPLVSKNNITKGWIIDGLRSVCGNTWSLKTFIVIPLNNNYKVFEIDSKAGISFNNISENEIEIWYYYQEWGGLGTYISFFVPAKELLRFENGNVTHKQGDLMKNISFLDKPLKDYYLEPSYLGLFAAGLNSKNVKLINYAFDNYFIEEDIEYNKEHDVPTTKAEINEVINSIEKNNKILEKHLHLLR